MSVAKAGLNADEYASHSLRIGLAAGEASVPLYTEKKEGRWNSDAYKSYVRQSNKSAAFMEECPPICPVRRVSLRYKIEEPRVQIAAFGRYLCYPAESFVGEINVGNRLLLAYAPISDISSFLLS